MKLEEIISETQRIYATHPDSVMDMKWREAVFMVRSAHQLGNHLKVAVEVLNKLRDDHIERAGHCYPQSASGGYCLTCEAILKFDSHGS